jgi:excisionase family DNA binding protein
MNTPTSQHEGSATGQATTMRQFNKAEVIAKQLGVCRRTIFRWANEGKLTRYKLNARVVLFDESEVMALVEDARIGPH